MFISNKYNNNYKKKKKKQLPPGPRGWPLVGDSWSWYKAVASSYPPEYVDRQVKRYGKIFSCTLFGKCAVVSADPSFNRFVMLNEGKLFQSSYPKSFRDLVGRNGIITAHGDQQRKLHGIASNFMRLDNVNSFQFLQHIQFVLLQTLNFYDSTHLVHLQDVCRKVAINLMVNQLFGVSTESDVNEMAHLFSDFSDGCLSVPINLPGFTYHKAMQARHKIIKRIKKTIESHRKLQSNSLINRNNGVLGRLLEEEILPDEEEHERLRSNSSIDGDAKILTWQDYKAMTFTQCVIDETLRIGGIAIWLMREAKQDVIYEDYVIPRGCFVVPFLSAVHLNENIYNDALTFNPWRWLEEPTMPMPMPMQQQQQQQQNHNKRNWRSSPYYSPFGGGPRFCPGADLARLQIALFLHHFVTTYKWSQQKEDQMSFFPSARLVNGFQILLTRKNT
ncbi:hypothetical protein ACFE04_024731 [Oxalis oulophora]